MLNKKQATLKITHFKSLLDNDLVILSKYPILEFPC